MIKHATYSFIFRIKGNSNNCPICSEILEEDTFYLSVFRDQKRDCITSRLLLTLKYCKICKKHYIGKNRIKKLRLKGHDISYNIKPLDSEEKINEQNENIFASCGKSLLEEVVRIRDRVIFRMNKSNKTDSFKQIESQSEGRKSNQQPMKRSCSNCLLERAQDCFGKKEICQFYQPCPSRKIDPAWPKEMPFNKNRFD